MEGMTIIDSCVIDCVVNTGGLNMSISHQNTRSIEILGHFYVRFSSHATKYSGGMNTEHWNTARFDV